MKKVIRGLVGQKNPRPHFHSTLGTTLASLNRFPPSTWTNRNTKKRTRSPTTPWTLQESICNLAFNSISNGPYLCSWCWLPALSLAAPYIEVIAASKTATAISSNWPPVRSESDVSNWNQYADFVVSMMTAPILYGSPFDAGRRSSSRPIQPSSRTVIGIRIEAPRSETP